MAQVLTTIFFSVAMFAAFGVIASMLADNHVQVRHALGLDPAPRLSSSRVRVRRPRGGGIMLRRPAATPLRAAA